MAEPRLSIVLAAAVFTGCASPNTPRHAEVQVENPFQKYYQNALAALPPNERKRVEVSLEPHVGIPIIITTTNLQPMVDDLMEKNFVPLGMSDFHGTMKVTQEQLSDFAQEIGADRVLFYSQHKSDETFVRREVRRDSESETTTTGSGTLTSRSDGRVFATAQGSGGGAFASANYSDNTSADYSGRQSTTTTTRRTHYVPYTVGHYSYAAIYWRHRQPPIFGALSAELSSEQRTTLQRNTGAVVRYVVSDSPAFNASILKGDLILSVNGITINSPTDLNNRIEGLAGQSIKIDLLRGKTPLAVNVQLNTPPSQLSGIER